MSRKTERNAGRKRDRRADRANGPFRTCRGCGRRERKGELLRFTRPSGDRPFIGSLLPGRGFYVCPAAGCVDRLEKGLGRWFTKEESTRVMTGLREIMER